MPAGVAAPGQASGVMPPQILGGPVWWFIVGVYVLAVALAVFCLVDSQLPRRAEQLAGLPEPALLYPISAGIYLVSVVAVWIPGLPRELSVVPVVLTPLALVLGVAYLLRVVFPKRPVDAEEPQK